MAVLKINGLSKSFGIKTVFENVSFEVRSGERIGLVGANGAGKTTLLRCLMGQEDYDKGSVSTSPGAVIGYLRQDFNYESQTLREEMELAWKDVLYYKDKLAELARKLETSHDEELVAAYGRTEERFEYLGGYDYEATTRKILTGLGFSDADWDRDIHGFSGGQKVRINLAAAFVRHPDFLFLDEPTNHLDMGMLEWLEEYLRSYRGGILMVSHDRYFLDATTTGIIDLENHQIHTYRGNYTQFTKVKALNEEAQERAYEKQQEHIRETEEYIRKYKAGIKAKQARGRQSQLDRLERIEKPIHRQSLHFQFEKPAECAEKVLDVMHVTSSYGDHVIFKDLTMHIKKGESVGLIGPNGAGKSTLLKLIVGDKRADGGFIQIGNRVKPGYYSQELDRLNSEYTVLEQIENDFDMGEREARNLLGMFLFRGDDVFKPVSLLSGGERARLTLLMLFLEKPNFLILDEPTNHLDIPTREIMEQALAAFGGTSLIVSHDRYFLDRVTTRILEMENGKLTEYLGNYSYYREKKKNLEEYERDRMEAESASSSGKSLPEKEPAKEKKSERKAESKAAPAPRKPVDSRKMDNIEMEIQRHEAMLKMLTVEMNQTPENYESIMAEYNQTKQKLEKLYDKWEEMAEMAE
ncbi:MAG: ATP-binding cassette domain-containing protein [Allisonella histaminiformans]|uniref:ABC transporter ATP-binding protein n=1 Tax=Allisonella histaminiformans TaxID=209880 RepID=UPI00235624C9|nr:ATP-binding cassette domain-containing protein [Allisonella histaminiformans]MCI6003099.1 ATP-binding cassette domain-containing protein [Allisonella histaminiformans]